MRCALALLLLASAISACDSAAAPAASGCPAGAHDQALVAVSTYGSSGFGGFALDATGYVSFGDTSGDPELETSAGRAFYIQRDVGKIYELDPRCGAQRVPAAVFEANDPVENGKATGSSDPQDVAVAPDGTLWVPRYLVPSVAVLAPSGGFAQTPISLTSPDYDPDGNPNASAITIETVGGVAKAFVSLEVLDDDTNGGFPKPYSSGHPSLMLRIDVTKRAIEAAIPLLGKNPFGLFASYGGYLWLAEPGDVDTANESNAGVERFDPQKSSSSMVLMESDLAGASVIEVAVTAGCGAAIVADPSPRNLTALVTFSPDTGAAITTYAHPAFGPTADFDLQGLLWLGNVLLVGDRSGNGPSYAVHAFDLSSGCVLTERHPDTLFLPLPPVAFRAALP